MVRWVHGWAQADQAKFGISLLGGDTTSTPGPFSLSLTISAMSRPVWRESLRRPDRLTVYGSPARSATARWDSRLRRAGLRPVRLLTIRYRLPQPRVGLAIGGIASAGMDVSDGLVQDLGHLCRASSFAAEIDATFVPLSEPAHSAGPDWLGHA